MYVEHHGQGYEFVVAWFDPLDDTNLLNWHSDNGWSVGTSFTDYYHDDYSAYTPYKDAYMPTNNYVPKNFLIDRDGYVRATDNTISAAEWEGWVEELL
jgi:hypothetical protein